MAMSGATKHLCQFKYLENTNYKPNFLSYPSI